MKDGDLLLITKGEYSDYGIIGLFKVIQDFDPLEKIEANKNRLEKGPHRDKPNRITSFLLSKNYIRELDKNELWLGYYGDLREISFNDETLEERRNKP